MFRTHNHERGNDKNKQKNNNVPRFTSMQILPPASSLLRPAPGLSGAAKVRPVAMPPLTKRTTTTTTTMTSNAEQLRSGWTVGVLEPIPMIYVLERTHVFVNESADMIANRIAECLRLGSMVASYHKQEVAVDVSTSDDVNFTVRLWQGENGPNHVLVEVQRVSGCSYSYCRAAKSVLRAAKGIQVNTLAGSSPSLRRALPLPCCIPKADPQEAEVAGREGFEIALNLLKQERLDTRLLAIESLEKLTFSKEYRSMTARSILSGEVCSTLLDLIQSSPSLMESENNHYISKTEQDHLAIMRRKAFVVLANSLLALEQECAAGELCHLLQQQHELTSRSMLESLTQELASASDRPHEACQATECLRILMLASKDVQQQAIEFGGISESLIFQAQRVGACRHVELEQACTKFRTHGFVE